MQNDLVGRKFAVGVAYPMMEPIYWTVQPNEVKDWRLIRRKTDSNAGTDLVYADIRLESSTQVLQGTLKLQYRRYDQGWQLESAGLESQPAITSRGGA